MMSAQPGAVIGYVQDGTSLGFPRESVCSHIAITRCAPAARSMAPPIPPPAWPGADQLARSPLPATW